MGLMLGPVIGGPLYKLCGYFWSFAIFAGFLIVSLAVSLIITPSSLNRKIEKNPLLKTQQKVVSYSMFLKNPRAMFSMMSCCIVCFFMSYQSPFLTDVLRKEKGIDEIWSGPILALPLATCFVGCILVNKAANLMSRRLLILVSFLVLGFSMFLQGPSLLLSFPDWNWIFLLGFAINGFAQGFIFIPLLPDALESVYIKQGITEGEDH